MAQFNTHGGYFAPNGYFRVNEGGSHEENPNGGVQVGVDQQGVPNMLEEGEPVYNDYVYSDNITAEKDILEKHNIPVKYAGKLYSKIADAFVDEAEDRPNDPISNNGLNAMLVRLADAQEEQKAIAQQKELEDELTNMSPEELDALEAMLAEQGAAEQQAMQEQAMAQQPMPEEQMMAEQQMTPEVKAPVEEVPQQPMMACGGKMRKFAPGGNLLVDPPDYVYNGGTLTPVTVTPNDVINYGTVDVPIMKQRSVRTQDAVNQDYLAELAEYNKRNPMGIWGESGADARKFMFENYPDVIQGWYDSLSDSQKKKVPIKTLTRDMQSKYVADAASGAMDTFGREYMPLITSGPMLAEGLISAPVSTLASVGGSYAGGYGGRKIDEAIGSENPYFELAGTLLGSIAGVRPSKKDPVGDLLAEDRQILAERNYKPGLTDAEIRSARAKQGWETRRAKAKAAEEAKAPDVKETNNTASEQPAKQNANTNNASAANNQVASDNTVQTQNKSNLKERSLRNRVGQTLWNPLFHYGRGYAVGRNAGWGKGRSILNAIGRGVPGMIPSNALYGGAGIGLSKLYNGISGEIDYRNIKFDENKKNDVVYGTFDESKYALGGPMNKYLTGGPLEDLVKEYIQKTGNFPDPNQYVILQRLANLGTISNEDYASLNPKFANGLNPNKVRPAEEFGTVNKSISGRRIIPDVYNGGQLDSVVVRPRENDTIYNGGNLDSIFVRPAPDIYDGGNLDSIVVRPNVVPQIDTLLTSSAELNPITVSADKPSPEESYSSDYLWKNLGNGIGKKQRRVSKGIITVGGRPYDPVTRQFLDPNTYAGNGYYIPLSGNFRQEKSVSGATSSSATSTNSNTSPKRVDPLGAIAPIATPSGVVAENKKYGPEWWPASAKEASENALNNKIDALPSDKRNIENTYNRVMANYNAAHENDEAFPTWMRYAGIANALGDMAWNLAQKPDKYKIPYVNPVLPNGRMDFIDPVFNPVDENMAVSDLMASEAAAARGLGASGLGPSTGANLLALDYNAGRNVGNARTQVWDANNQMRNQIIAQRNANAQALGQFRYGISRDRAGILNNFAMQNLHNRLLQQRLNNAAEQEKWNAFSQSKNALAKGLSDIGYENANRNMINLNEAIDYLIGNGFDVQYKGNRACGGTLLRKYKK